MSQITVCHCERCDEPDPVCEHGVSTYDADCESCSAIADERLDEEIKRLRRRLAVVERRGYEIGNRLEHLTGRRR